MQETFDPNAGRFGRNTPEEMVQRSAAEQQMIQSNIAMMRPLENMRTTPILEMQSTEFEPIVEALRGSTLEVHNSLFHRQEEAIQTYRFKTEFYTTQGERESAIRQVTMLENMIYSLPEGPRFASNEKLLAYQVNELRRGLATVNVFEWALPYLTTYYGGLESMGLLPQRGGQLYLGDMEMMLNGIDSGLFDEGRPEPLDSDKFPEVEIKRREAEIALWDNVNQLMPNSENGETVSDRFGRYVADADFVFRALGEINTFNSTVPGEELRLTETMEHFLGESFQRRPRTFETGGREVISAPTRKITVYLDANGNQIPQDGDGNPIRPLTNTDTRHEQFIDVLDYYNKARSDDEMKYVICLTAAMAIHDAKRVLDGLDPRIEIARNARPSDTENPVYIDLFNKVQKTAHEMMSHMKKPRRGDVNFMLAKSAVYMAHAIGYGSMDVGERGGSYTWEMDNIVYHPQDASLPKKDRRIISFTWKTEPGQGDPTAAGDSFTAHKPLLHEAIYQAIKARVSAFGQGLEVPIEGAEKSAQKMLQVLMSKEAEKADRREVVNMVAQGKHLYLARYFGMLGAFRKEFTDPNDPGYARSEAARRAWAEGAAETASLGKTVNENFSRAVEQHVIFVRTPFNFKTIREAGLKPTDKANDIIESFAVGNENVIYPMLLVQPGVGLFDMLSVSAKEASPYSAGDMLRKTWKKNSRGLWEETSPQKGGIRLTLKDINWEQYPRYAEDGSAVNRKFMLELVAPLYSTANPDEVKGAQTNPMVTITKKIKAADIGYRWVLEKLERTSDNSGEMVKRPTLEAMTTSTIIFNELALGVHGLIGRGAMGRFYNMVEEVLPQELGEGDKNNLYTTLRNIEDLLPIKQGYDHYADTFFMATLAQAKAMEATAMASDFMARATTVRFEKAHTTNVGRWSELKDLSLK